MASSTEVQPLTRFSEKYIEAHLSQHQYDLDAVVGTLIDIKPVSWNTRDVLLYAIGIGAGQDDLRLVYEKHPQFAAFPTYPTTLDLKETRSDVVPFRNPCPPVAGLPVFDQRTLLHTGHAIQVLKALPAESGEGWTQSKRIVGLHEKPKGFLIDMEVVIADPQGVVYNIAYANLFYVKGKANGVPYSKSNGGLLPLIGKVPKDKAPDFVEQFTTSPTQAITFRLCGDYNPHCVDPALGVKAGLKGATLHGLATWGICARLIVEALAGGETSALKAYSLRFSSPVQPGDKLQVNIWDTGIIVADGSKEYAFEAVNVTTGKKAGSGGVAHVAVDAKLKL